MSSPLTILQVPRRIALWIISFVVTVSTAVSFVESYRALYVWAANHQVFGNFTYIWPLMIDSFIIVGEATLFVAMTDSWTPRARVFPWTVTIGGLVVSVAGNVGHVHTHGTLVSVLATRATAAVAPMAASASLAVGLGVLKRVIRLHQSTAVVPVQAYSGEQLEALTSAEHVATEVLGSSEPVRTRTWSRDPKRVQDIQRVLNSMGQV